jgi:hypothetical protein
MAEKRKKAPPKWRLWMLIVGAVAIGGGIYNIMSTPERLAPPSNLTGAKINAAESVVGDNRGSERYNQAVADDNDQKAEEAIKKGSTYIPAAEPYKADLTMVETLTEEVKKDELTIPEVIQAPMLTQNDINRNETRSRGSNVAPNAAMANAMSSYMEQWMGGRLAPTVVYEPDVVDEAKPQNGSVPEVVAENESDTNITVLEHAPFNVGDILYGVSVLASNSDSPGPVKATVLSGPHRGGVFVGGFTRQGERLILEYNIFTDKFGESYSVTAFAVDPETSAPSVSSDVDHHYLSRWGGLVASSFLKGFGDAVGTSGRSSILSSTGETLETSTPDYSFNERAWIAAGEVGTKLSSKADKGFDRPPTVTLDPSKTIGILIIEK